MKKLLYSLLLPSSLTSKASKGENEEELRTPENPDQVSAVSGAFRVWEEEYWRRRNYNESKDRRYTLPVIPDTIEEWEKQRVQILKDAQECLYGTMPPAPDSFEIKLLSERRGALGGLALRREYRLYCSMNNGRKFNFDMLLYVPLEASVPPPVFVALNFFGNQGSTPDTDVRPVRYRGISGAEEIRRQYRLERMNYTEAIRRGYAVATACYHEIFPDNMDGARKSIFSLFCDDLRPDYEVSVQELQEGRKRTYGAYAGWAWGYSRIADALEKIDLIDSSRMACAGQSRLGSASMVAGIFDPRFKLVCVNNSGQGGAPLLRRNFGGELDILSLGRCSFWTSPRIIRYVGREDELPFDSHQLLGLIAPRALYVTSSDKDLNADPYGTFLAVKEASKVWGLYGQKALKDAENPVADVPLKSPGVRYHVKTGGHSITPYDWAQFYDFADELFGKK